MGDTNSKLSVSHAADAEYESFGPRGVYRTRDLGVKAATGGAFEARILGAAAPGPVRGPDPGAVVGAVFDRGELRANWWNRGSARMCLNR